MNTKAEHDETAGGKPELPVMSKDERRIYRRLGLFSPQDFRTAIANQCGVASEAAKPEAPEALAWPTVAEQVAYWKKQEHDNDPGGNVTPDRVEANEERYQ